MCVCTRVYAGWLVLHSLSSSFISIHHTAVCQTIEFLSCGFDIDKFIRINNKESRKTVCVCCQALKYTNLFRFFLLSFHPINNYGNFCKYHFMLLASAHPYSLLHNMYSIISYKIVDILEIILLIFFFKHVSMFFPHNKRKYIDALNMLTSYYENQKKTFFFSIFFIGGCKLLNSIEIV